MMPGARASEERYPLLLLYVEDKGKRSEFPQRVLFADKDRGNQIFKGAAAIVTQWPAQITSCWIRSLGIGCTFIIMCIMILLTILNPTIHQTHPRCTRDTMDYHGNTTIHLIKDGDVWNRQELDLLKFIAETYPDFEIHTTIVEPNEVQLKQHELQQQEKVNRSKYINSFNRSDINNPIYERLAELLPLYRKFYTNIDKNRVQNVTAKVVKRIKRNAALYRASHGTYEDVVQAFTNIKEKRITFKNYFLNTPLHYFWMDFNEEMILFAMRIQELWQHGGISFQLTYDNKNSLPFKTKSNVMKLRKVANDNLMAKMLVANTRLQYENLPEDLISIDEKGILMATHMPCHTFFGEMIMKLQKHSEEASVKNLIQETLNTFCGRGAVNSDYCKKIKKV